MAVLEEGAPASSPQLRFWPCFSILAILFSFGDLFLANGTHRLAVLEEGAPAAAEWHPPLVAEEGVGGPVVRAVAVLRCVRGLISFCLSALFII